CRRTSGRSRSPSTGASTRTRRGASPGRGIWTRACSNTMGRELPQIPALTTLRGLLALWVVVYHFWNDIVALLPGLRLLTPLAIRGNFAVPGFFVLSGFVLARNHLADFVVPTRQRILRFLGLRLFRIYPVHLATLLVVLAMVVYARRAGLVLDWN